MNKTNKQTFRCKICDKSYNNLCGLTTHIFKKHNLKSHEYYDIYYKKPNEGICKICRIKTNFISITKGYNIYCNRQCMGKNISNISKNINIKEVFDISLSENIYLLGLLWADGWITKKYNSVKIEILKSDYNDIRHIFKNWNIYLKTNSAKNETVTCCINNYQFHELLKNSDYFDKKIKTPKKILDIIPKNLHYYFWRGYFDGDGCFYYKMNKYPIRQVFFTSSYEQDWSEHEIMLDMLNIDKYKINKIVTKTKGVNGKFNQYSQLRFTQKDLIKKFGDYIYQGSLFGLERKYQKFNSMFNLL